MHVFIFFQDALAAAFVEGWLFILLSILGVRGKIMALIPHRWGS
jgi:xanthine/uracil/vitamin C permease (AzgA family)